MFTWKMVSKLEPYPDRITLFMLTIGNTFRNRVTNTYADGGLIPYLYGAYKPASILVVQEALMRKRRRIG